MWRASLYAWAAVGLKATPTLKLWPGARAVVPVKPETMNKEEEDETLRTLKGVVPPLVTVTFWAALWVLTTWFPKFSEPGLTWLLSPTCLHVTVPFAMLH